MQHELRMGHHQFGRFPRAKLIGFDTASISVATTDKPPRAATLVWQCTTLLELVSTVKIELPVLFQSRMAWLADLTRLVENMPIAIVANDLGALHYLSRHLRSDRATLHAGRWLSYSFYNTPGYESILEKDQGAWMTYNTANDMTLEMLIDMGVSGMEVDLFPEAENELREIKRRGLNVTVFGAQPLASHSRRTIVDSSDAFDATGAQLAPKHRWIRFEDSFIPISENIKELLGQLSARGNTVTRNAALDTTQLSAFDTLCTDLQHSH